MDEGTESETLKVLWHRLCSPHSSDTTSSLQPHSSDGEAYSGAKLADQQVSTFIGNSEIAKALLLLASVNPITTVDMSKLATTGAAAASSLRSRTGGRVIDALLEAQRFAIIVSIHPFNPATAEISSPSAIATQILGGGPNVRTSSVLGVSGLGFDEFKWAMSQPELKAMLGIGPSLERALEVIDFFLSGGTGKFLDKDDIEHSSSDEEDEESEGQQHARKDKFPRLSFECKKFLATVIQALGLTTVGSSGQGRGKKKKTFSSHHIPCSSLSSIPLEVLERAVNFAIDYGGNLSASSGPLSNHLLSLNPGFWPGAPNLSSHAFLTSDPATAQIIGSKLPGGPLGLWIEERRGFNPLVEKMQNSHVLSEGLVEAFTKNSKLANLAWASSSSSDAAASSPSVPSPESGSVLCFWSLMHRASLLLLAIYGEEKAMTFVYGFISENFTETANPSSMASPLLTSPSHSFTPSGGGFRANSSVLFGSGAPTNGFPLPTSTGSSNVTPAALASFFSGLTGFGFPTGGISGVDETVAGATGGGDQSSTSASPQKLDENVICFSTLMGRLSDAGFMCRITGKAQPGHSVPKHTLKSLLQTEIGAIGVASASRTEAAVALQSGGSVGDRARWKELLRQGQPIRGVCHTPKNFSSPFTTAAFEKTHKPPGQSGAGDDNEGEASPDRWNPTAALSPALAAALNSVNTSTNNINLDPLGLDNPQGRRLGVKLSDCMALALAWMFHGQAVETAWKLSSIERKKKQLMVAASGLDNVVDAQNQTPERQTSSLLFSGGGAAAAGTINNSFISATGVAHQVRPIQPRAELQSKGRSSLAKVSTTELDQQHVLNFVVCTEPDPSLGVAGSAGGPKGPVAGQTLCSATNPQEDYGGGLLHWGDILQCRRPGKHQLVGTHGQRYGVSSVTPGLLANDATMIAAEASQELTVPVSTNFLVEGVEANRKRTSTGYDSCDVPLDELERDFAGESSVAATAGVGSSSAGAGGPSMARRNLVHESIAAAESWPHLLRESLISSTHALHCSSLLTTATTLSKERMSLGGGPPTPPTPQMKMTRISDLLYPAPMCATTALKEFSRPTTGPIAAKRVNAGQAQQPPPQGMKYNDEGKLVVDDEEMAGGKLLDAPIAHRPAAIHSILHELYSVSDYTKSLGQIATAVVLDQKEESRRNNPTSAAAAATWETHSSVPSMSLTNDFESVSASVQYMLASRQKMRAEQVSRRHRLQEKMKVLRSMCNRDAFLRTELAHISKDLELSEVQLPIADESTPVMKNESDDITKLKELAMKKQELFDRKRKAEEEVDRCRHISKTLLATRTELLEEVADLKLKMKKQYRNQHSLVQSQLDDHAREMAQTLRAEQSVLKDRTQAVNLTISSLEGPRRTQLYDHYDKKIDSIEEEKKMMQKRLDELEADLVRVTLSPIGKWRRW